MSSKAMTPNQREGISAQSTITGNQEYLTSTNHILNVNATFSASAIALQDGVDSNIKATVFDLTNSNPLATQIVDANGTAITSFGGGTQYTNGSATVANPTGTIPVYDNGGTIASVSTTNRLPVSATQSGTWNVGASSATGSAVPANAFYVAGINASGNLIGLSTVDRPNDSATGSSILATGNYIYNGTNFDRMRSAINATNSTGTGIQAVGNLAQFDDVSPTSITENQFGNLRMSANRNLYGTIRDAAGNERGANVTAGNALVVDGSASTQPVSGTVAVSSVIAGTGATNLGKAEDAAHTSGDTGVMPLGVRNDGAATSFSGTNGDYTPIGTDAQGRVYVVQKAPTATLSNVPATATSVTVLAANTARVGAQVYNDSSAVLYLKFGTTASTTSFTVPLTANTYYEVPAGYTGIIDGIWASATGAARVTEEV